MSQVVTTKTLLAVFKNFLKMFYFHFSIFRYFFYVLTALIVLGVFNGLVFLPVLLVMIGPPPEVVPRRNNGSGSSNRIDPPSPEPSPAPVRSASFHHRQPNTVSSIYQQQTTFFEWILKFIRHCFPLVIVAWITCDQNFDGF